VELGPEEERSFLRYKGAPAVAIGWSAKANQHVGRRSAPSCPPSRRTCRPVSS
jgi:hypothetical protein